MAGTEGRRSVRPPSRGLILRRIERETGLPGLARILGEKLSPTDLQSLLLEVYALRARRREPRSLLEDHLSNRFVRPSSLSPQRLSIWDALAWSRLPEGFEAIELSPVAPLGTVSALAPLSQDWSITTSRNTEVISDVTNVLALEASARRAGPGGRRNPPPPRVHLAASQRVLRGQRFGEGPGVRQHFRLFSLCSAGRDEGGLRFETETACTHIGFFVRCLGAYLGDVVPIRVALADLAEPSHREILEAGIVRPLTRTFAGTPVEWEPATPAGAAYYRSVRFHIYAKRSDGSEKELVDGGDVDWGQKLLNHGKERMFISGLGSERLAQLFEPRPSVGNAGHE